jgi:hypothetical protein
MKYAPDNVKERINELKRNPQLSQEDTQTAIDEILNLERGHLGNYVTDLRSYTDNLAGKKSIGDRGWENNLGRGIYQVMDTLQNQVSRNMIAINPGSWLTNLIPLTQGGAAVKTKNFLRAAYDTAKSYRNDDGFVDKSAFLTSRRGSDPLVKSIIQKVTDVGMAPMKFIDDITTNILVRAKYYDLMDNGMNPKDAMSQADQFTANAVADRSKGSLPTAFNNKNPMARLFTMFQVEVNNQLSFMFKDVPEIAKQNGGKWMASTLMKFMIGSWIFNKLFEMITGRKPAIDPIGTVEDVVKNIDNPQGIMNGLKENVVGQIPFIGGLVGGGRLPISAALPDWQQVGEGALGIAKGEGSIGENIGKIAVGLLKNPATYIAMPLGGGQIKKSIEGIGAYSRGYSQTDTQKMRFPIAKNAGNALRTGVFGQYSTPEAREYFDQGRAPLSAQQTDKINRMVEAGIDTQIAYDMFRALKRYSKKAQQQAYIRNYKGLSDPQKMRFAKIYFD